jgi:DNA (cytosine-5)-methyltransferase 1
MKYGSVCSGVEAATVAWHPLGWEPQWFSEIEKFPSAVLDHHYPNTPNLGDMTKFKEWPNDPIDLLVGGTPCQSFSVAGLRKGLDDPRGNLMLTYVAIAARYKPRWLVWENVPGVLSSNSGRDFGTLLTALGEIGYGFAYRVLDAQYFGVAQRRRRVFVVGYLGDWRRAAAVLFERESLSGHPAPSRQARQEIAPTVTSGAPFSRTGNQRVEAEALVTGPLTAGMGKGPRGTEAIEGNHIIPTFVDDVANTIQTTCNDYSRADGFNMIAFGAQNSASQGDSVSEHVTPTLDKSKTPAVMDNLSVRRLTPIECERLQGFPDNYTQIPWRNKEPENCPDGPRYKAMGNSMAVPVMQWIGKRIQMVEEIQ